MRAWIVVAVVAALWLSGCQKSTDTAAGMLGGGHGRGRYLGVGLYPAGRMWAQVVSAGSAKDPAASLPKDDEQIIVVLDSATGELRQCGNLSGACIAMNPWFGPLAASHQAPVLLGKHAEQLDAEAEATEKQAEAEAAKKAPARVELHVNAR